MERTSLSQLARLFLRLGTISFGGPASHLAMMEDEVVVRRRWLSREQFLDLLGATHLIPGPNSTEMAIHVGYTQAGWRGLLVAGSCFIIPAAILTVVFAYIYVRFGMLPQAGSMLAGIKPAAVAIICGMVIRFSKLIVKSRLMVGIGVLVFTLNLLHVGEITLLFGAGLTGALWENRHRVWNAGKTLSCLMPMAAGSAVFAESAGALTPPTLTGLGLFFLKIGSILYGSGYVLVAFLQSGLVDSRHWLTQAQLIDAVAVGQMTPGPVLSTATFIGYVMLGLPGAVVATAGIFFPSFVFVWISSPWIPRLREKLATRGFLNGVNAGSCGLMAAVALRLAMGTMTHLSAWMIFVAALLALYRWNLNSAWIVLGGALVGWGLGQV